MSVMAARATAPRHGYPVVGDGGRHFANGAAVRQALDNATVTRADIGQRAERRQAKRCLAQHPLCILVGVAPIAA